MQLLLLFECAILKSSYPIQAQALAAATGYRRMKGIRRLHSRIQILAPVPRLSLRDATEYLQACFVLLFRSSAVSAVTWYYLDLRSTLLHSSFTYTRYLLAQSGLITDRHSIAHLSPLLVCESYQRPETSTAKHFHVWPSCMQFMVPCLNNYRILFLTKEFYVHPLV